MSTPEMDPLSSFNIPDIFAADLAREIPKIDSPTTDKVEQALEYLYILDKKESTIEFIGSDFTEKAQAIKSEKMTPQNQKNSGVKQEEIRGRDS